MLCDRNMELIGPYVDGELDLPAALDVEQHLEDCRACQQAHRQLRRLCTSIAAGAPYYKAPAALMEKLLPHPALAPQFQPRRRAFLRPLLAAAIFLLIASLAVTILLRNRPDTDALARELVSAHVRSTQADHLLDVVSSDQHTVKPWFSGKIDFAPPVCDFANAGFPLQGGRLDYISARPVAALIYRHDRHVINCFIWPATTSESAPSAMTAQGYSIVHFDHAQLSWYLVSDASPQTLEQLAQQLQK